MLKEMRTRTESSQKKMCQKPNIKTNVDFRVGEGRKRSVQTYGSQYTPTVSTAPGTNQSLHNKSRFGKQIRFSDRMPDTLHINTSVSNSSNKKFNSVEKSSRNAIKSIIKQELTRVHTDYNNNLKVFEKLIQGIKNVGFEKTKNNIEELTNAKMELEARVFKLQSELNFVNSQKKKFGTKNLTFEQETSRSLSIKEVRLAIICRG